VVSLAPPRSGIGSSKSVDHGISGERLLQCCHLFLTWNDYAPR
jgi:hypothetical protein